MIATSKNTPPLELLSAVIIEFKPSGFYYRQALRDETERAELAAIVVSLRKEFDLSADYARRHNLSIAGVDEWARMPSRPVELREMGLELCCRLEELRQAIRRRGLHPPKRYLMSTEVEDKRLRL